MPQSFLGRSLLTWFNPGPGTGYMFALANLLSAALAAAGMMIFWAAISPSAATGRWASYDRVLMFAVAGFSYITIYLGIGRLVVRALQRVAPVGIALSLLVQVLMIVAGTGIPLVIYLMSANRGDGYTLLQITNPIWTLVEILDRGTGAYYADVVVMLLAPIAVLIFLANLPSIAAEVRHVRIAKPLRVAEEDAQLAAEHAPAHVKTNPWDEG